jgi:hypothetical protein
MKLNLFFLSAAVLVNAASATVVATVNLRTAANYAILSKAGISTVPTSVITGDIAVSPITGTAITGFSLIADGGMKMTSSQVLGDVFAANYLGDTPTLLTAAVSDMETAYTDTAGRANTEGVNLFTGELGGHTLTAGVYTFGSDVSIADGDLTLNGSATDIFIIQVSNNLNVAAGKQVLLSGGVLPQNIFWQVAEKVNVAAGAHMEGIILCQTSVAFAAGSSLNGRVLAQTAVTLSSTTVTQPNTTPSRRLRGVAALQ